MAEAGTLHDAFIDELRDVYDGERQLTKALAKLAKTATAAPLRDAFESHLQETQGQIERLEQVFESLEGHDEAADLLQENLDEEKAADEKLSDLAEGGINQSAVDAAHPDEEPVAAGASGARKGSAKGKAGRRR
jgi:ferritin-like metal-binding protein YciE